MSGATRRALTATLIALVAALAYAPAFDAGFAFDDPAAVVDNPVVRGEAPLSQAFTGNFWGDRPGFEHLASWRPLTLLSLRVDHLVGEGAAAPFHATNVALHALAALLCWVAAARLGAAPLAAAAAGLFVAAHPVFAEAVASVVGRGDLLAAAFALGALMLWRDRPAAALGALALALLSKETALAAAAALALHAAWRRQWPRAGAVLALTAAWYGARALAVGHLGGALDASDNPLVALSTADRLVAGLGVVGRMIAWTLWPQPVAPDYAHGVDLAGPLAAYAWLGALALAALSAGLFAALRRDAPAAALGLATALAGLVLASNLLFPLPTPLAGRLAYLPACGLALAAAAAALPRAPHLAPAALALLAAVGLPATWATAHAWRDDATLFAFAVQTEPTSVRARVNLAAALLAGDAPDAARPHLEAALALAPDHPTALTNLSVLADRQRRPDEALALARRAAAGERRPGRAHANLCAMALRAPAADPAALAPTLDVCRLAAAGLPRAPEPRVNLARALARAGHLAEAEATFAAARALAPDSELVAGHFIGFLAETGRPDQALALQRDLVARRPDDPVRRRNLVALAFQAADHARRQGRPADACALAREGAAVAGPVPAVTARMQALCAAAPPR